MSKITQKEAVYTAIRSVISEAGHKFEDGMDIGKIMSRELRAQVNQILVEGFSSQSIELDREYSEKDLKAYVSGLQSNWIRKDKRLNGNVAYVAKNPGTRAGSTDPQIKAMKTLLSTLEAGTADYDEVQTCISARQSELNVAKTKKVVDFSALPEALRAKFQK